MRICGRDATTVAINHGQFVLVHQFPDYGASLFFTKQSGQPLHKKFMPGFSLSCPHLPGC